MIEIVGMFSLIAIGCINFLVLLRLIIGPTPADRIMSLDVLTVNAIIMLVLFGIIRNTTIFFEVAMAFAILSFMGTVALGFFFERGDIFGTDR